MPPQSPSQRLSHRPSKTPRRNTPKGQVKRGNREVTRPLCQEFWTHEIHTPEDRFDYRPECPTGFLWYELEDGSAIKLAQVAHIVAASTQGPRAGPGATDDSLTSIKNLVLLCPTCHVLVDRAPHHESTPADPGSVVVGPTWPYWQTPPTDSTEPTWSYAACAACDPARTCSTWLRRNPRSPGAMPI